MRANKKYHVFNTCNNWVNRGLKKTGIRTAVWTAGAFGLFIDEKKRTFHVIH